MIYHDAIRANQRYHAAPRQPRPRRGRDVPTPKWVWILVAVLVPLAVTITILMARSGDLNYPPGTGPGGDPTCPAGQYWAEKYNMCWP